MVAVVDALNQWRDEVDASTTRAIKSFGHDR
jgi:hypothetical protein